MVFYKKHTVKVWRTSSTKQRPMTADGKNQSNVLVCSFRGAATSRSTHFHKVGVDVIGAHDVGISRMQDDPGVVDLWEEDVSQEFVGEREEAVLITRADHWLPVRISLTNREML